MLERFVVGMLECNGYILYDEKTLDAFVIDPGDEAKTFMQYIDKHSLKLQGILLTHYHYDHIGAVEELKKKYDCPVCIHKKDAKGLEEPKLNHSMSGFRRAIAIKADKLLTDGEVLQAGELSLEVIHTPGHTPGSICLKVEKEKIILTGDTIFDDDLGRTDLEGGSCDSMRKSIINKIAKWEDEITIYPGHADSATMVYVRKKNREYLDIIKGR